MVKNYQPPLTAHIAQCAVFISDNGCNNESYNLSREPVFFRDMQTTVDDMHFTGHKRCCTAYSTREYASIKNSPLAEQKNSRLSGIKKQLMFMTQLNFIFKLRYFVLRLNMRQRNISEQGRSIV